MRAEQLRIELALCRARRNGGATGATPVAIYMDAEHWAELVSTSHLERLVPRVFDENRATFEGVPVYVAERRTTCFSPPAPRHFRIVTEAWL